jgi:hypothetical protein
MVEVTKAEPEMWGNSIVGFGRYRYKYESGREGEGMITGFSPRKSDLTLYIMPGFEPFPDLMGRLGKYKTGKSCLYIKKLDDVDLNVLRELVDKSITMMADKRIDKRVDCSPGKAKGLWLIRQSPFLRSVLQYYRTSSGTDVVRCRPPPVPLIVST